MGNIDMDKESVIRLYRNLMATMLAVSLQMMQKSIFYVSICVGCVILNEKLPSKRVKICTVYVNQGASGFQNVLKFVYADFCESAHYIPSMLLSVPGLAIEI